MLDGQKPFFLVSSFTDNKFRVCFLCSSFVQQSHFIGKSIVLPVGHPFAYNFLFLYSGGVKIVQFSRVFKMQKSA